MSEVLFGWKAVAEWFGVSIRTVKLWYYESRPPLPVRKTPTGSMIALVRELEQWIMDGCSNGSKPLKRHDAANYQGYGVGRSSSRKVSVVGDEGPPPEERARWRDISVYSELEMESMAFEEAKERRFYAQWAKEYARNPLVGSYQQWKRRRV